MPHDGPAWTPELLAAPHHAPDKAARIRRMFNGIAPRYELINSLFSAGRDAAWRRKAVQFAGVHEDDVVLDIACGTGDFARAFAAAGAQRVVGCDFAHEMLIRAVGLNPRGANRAAGFPSAPGRVCPCRLKPTAQTLGWCEADALRLPFRSGSFSITSCAFGVRNFANLDAGLSEMFRVLGPGGRTVILEFTRPQNRLLRAFYELYSGRLMPVAATLISGDRCGAYRYLPRSVVSFLDAEQMCGRLSHAGFDRVKATALDLGLVTVYVAMRT